MGNLHGLRHALTVFHIDQLQVGGLGLQRSPAQSQLLRRIEEPMKKFAANKTIMATKESKRIVKTYNRVARALIEFETLWHQAWIRSIENAKAGLQARNQHGSPASGATIATTCSH
jgi:hypothetical protein